MKRALLGVAFTALIAGAPWIAGSAAAAPVGTTFTLHCDHNVDATVSLKLWGPNGTDAGSIDALSCGANSGFGTHNRVSWPLDVVTIDVTSFSGSWGAQNCTQTGVSVPTKVNCPAGGGTGATLSAQ